MIVDPAVDDKYCYVFTGSNYSPVYGEFRMIDRNTGNTTYLITDTGFTYNGSRDMNSAVVLGPNHDAFSTNPPGTLPDYWDKPLGQRMKMCESPPISSGLYPAAIAAAAAQAALIRLCS